MATTVHEGRYDVEGLRFAIVVTRFNEVVTSRLLDGAVDALERHGVPEDRRTVVRVPGAWELAQVVTRLADRKRFDAVIALGCLVRGETSHYDLIATAASKGLSEAATASGVPVALGLLTTETLDQAVERAGGKAGNKGWDAAMSAIEMADLYRRLDGGA